jgi:type II secretory ATPase GspE/PulE/Tfp pilus assembly ATPase PilB-like protein
LGKLLLGEGAISEEELAQGLASKSFLEYWTVEESGPQAGFRDLIPERFARSYHVLPLSLDSEANLIVAVADPFDLGISDHLERLCRLRGFNLKRVVGSPSSIVQGIDSAYGDSSTPTVGSSHSNVQRGARTELVSSGDLPEIRRILNDILYRAVVDGASDVHIENLESEVRVRFRIDGILQVRTFSVNKSNVDKVISVLKIEAGLDITERRRPQDGVIQKRIGSDWSIDLRVHTHRSQFGGDAVVRVLDGTRKLPDPGQLGLSGAILDSYCRIVANPQGLILITGPTGSGKSTTLYSTLTRLNTVQRKIVTAEDPVEYHLPGICQYPVNDRIGNSFSEYARRFLRKDPDVILIGEIRDETTAEACIRAAMTGHLVFSTLHTNQTTAAVARLRDLRVEPPLICEALLGVLAQRLIRTNCRNCRQAYEPDERVISAFGNLVDPRTEFWRGAGCDECQGSGFRGRIGVFELWRIDEQSRISIRSGKDERELRRNAARSGMEPLVSDALSKVRQGLSTLEEVRRVVPID